MDVCAPIHSTTAPASFESIGSSADEIREKGAPAKMALDTNLDENSMSYFDDKALVSWEDGIDPGEYARRILQQCTVLQFALSHMSKSIKPEELPSAARKAMTVLRDTLGEVVCTMPVEAAEPAPLASTVSTVRTAPETNCSALSQATTLRPFDSISTAEAAQRKPCEVHRRLRLFCPQRRGERCYSSLRDVLDSISRWRFKDHTQWVDRENRPENPPWKYVDRKLLESVLSDDSIVDLFERLYISRVNQAKKIAVPPCKHSRRGFQKKFKDKVDALRKSENSQRGTDNDYRFRYGPLRLRPAS